MSDVNQWIASVGQWKARLQADQEGFEAVVQKAYGANTWFLPEFIHKAFDAIADEFLDPEKLKSWLAMYPQQAGEARTIGLIMAGNLPLVGFHDLLCVLAAGHKAVIKLSDKDPYLLPWMTRHWMEVMPAMQEAIRYTDRLETYDAVIATGTNNSARYFEYYFAHCPHILRRNRNGVAILTGEESADELKQLASDMMLFFGMGCRNVSKLYIPPGFDLERFRDALSDWTHLAYHTRYGHNLEYDAAIYIINQVPHLHLGALILTPQEDIASRIGCVHYEYYDDPLDLAAMLAKNREAIQCVVSQQSIAGWDVVPFGQTQRPQLAQYADGVDTMQFLTTL